MKQEMQNNELQEGIREPLKEHYKQTLLNEIGDTERGRTMLKGYIRAARRDREEALWRGNDIYSEIQDSLPRTGALRDASSDAYHAAEEPANKLFRRASRRRMGILAAYRRLLGMNEDFGEHSGELLNEIGDTLRGKIKLISYLNSRSKDLESLEKEAKRLDDVKQTHMGNIRKGRIPSDRVIDTLYNMGVNLTRKEGRYKQGMKRAVGALGLPFFRQDNSTTIKEHYKNILTEAISKDPHVDNHFGAIVDHNAGAGIDPTSNANDTIAKAQQIVNAAASGGHHGLSVNSKGQIISTSITKDWTGRGDMVKAEVVRATSKPFASVDGNHHWFRSESNAPEGMGEYLGGRPYEGRIYSPDYKGLRGEDADNDPNPTETASRMGLDASGRKRMGM